MFSGFARAWVAGMAAAAAVFSTWVVIAPSREIGACSIFSVMYEDAEGAAHYVGPDVARSVCSFPEGGVVLNMMLTAVVLAFSLAAAAWVARGFSRAGDPWSLKN